MERRKQLRVVLGLGALATVALAGTPANALLFENLQFDTFSGLSGRLNSRAVIENINTSVTNKTSTVDVGHKSNYTWRFYGGRKAVLIRLHFSKFNLGSNTANRLEILDGTGAKKYTLTGSGPSGGWTSYVFGSTVQWRLVTTNASQSHGFAIDKVDVISLKTATSSTPWAMTVPQSNVEWHGTVLAGQYEDFFFKVPATARYDFFAEIPSGFSLQLVLQQPTSGSPAATQTFYGPTKSGVTSRMITAKFKAGNYMARVKAGSSPGLFNFMVNRVPYLLNVEVEMDDYPGTQISGRECQLKALFREASERLYGATDGYIRFNKIYYFTSTDLLNAVDAQFEYEDLRAHAPVGDFLANFGHIAMGKNHLEFYKNSSCPSFGGATRDGGGTFVHEWGHYDIGLWDEYVDISGTSRNQCPHSLMGNSSGRFEFCTQLTHDPRNRWGWASAFTQGDNSCWRDLEDEYPSLPERTKTPNPFEFRRSAIGKAVVFKRNLRCKKIWLIGYTGFGPDCD